MKYLLLIKDYDDPYNIMDIVAFKSSKDMEQAEEILGMCDMKEPNDELYKGFFGELKSNGIEFERIEDWISYHY